ncbi:MAG: YezD family protein [Akkermansiaceae bacterium]|nr:YezD family protein [Armatimonadota bacterium]
MSEDNTSVPTISHPTGTAGDKKHKAVESTEYPLTAIEEAVRSIRFGTVQIVIQDGRIVQIEKTEKIRLR